MKRISYYVNALKIRYNLAIIQNKHHKINQQIVVIESDDWGSIRMPSLDVYNRLLDHDIRVDRCHYCTYDTLESKDDLVELYEILSKYKDKNGNHPIVTLNYVLANPDFNKIKDNNYQQYFYEDIIDTYIHYNRGNIKYVIDQGIDNNLIYPQLHGREHVNVNRWIQYLQKKSLDTLFAFENKCFGISTSIVKERRGSYMAALDARTNDELNNDKQIIKEAVILFKRYFGYQPFSFIAPNYIWNPTLNSIFKENGIIYLQGNGVQKYYDIDKNKICYKYHYIGEKNLDNMMYSVRNCIFEPSSNIMSDMVDTCLSQINDCFEKKIPAIVCMHRVNLMGGLHEKNRKNSLRQLDILLKSIITRYPNVEFMNSVQLMNLLKNDN